MTITIREQQIELRYTIKGLIIFETIKRETPNSGNLFDTVALLWSFIRAEIDRKGLLIDYKLEEFVDWLDSEPTRLSECTEWLTQEQARQTELLDGSKKKTV